jgi:lactoylglutathione lyase
MLWKSVDSGMKKILILPCCLFLTGMAMTGFAQQKASLNHIALYVTNLQKSTEFYRDIVGLDTIPEPFHDGLHTWFGVGPKSHLCFTVQDVPAFARMLELKGIPFEDWPGSKGKITTRIDGVHQVYLRDPDGYWLEINDARE